MSSYAQLADLYRFGLPNAALPPEILSSDRQAALDAASDLVDSYLRDRYVLPLRTIPVSIARCVAIIAAYDILIVRGFDPSTGPDEQLAMRYKDQIDWLKGVASGKVRPTLVDSSPGGVVGGPAVLQGGVGGSSSQTSPTVQGGSSTGANFVIGPPAGRGWK